MRNHLAALSAMALFLVCNGHASAEDCLSDVTPELLNPDNPSPSQDLGRGIGCLAQLISVDVSGIAEPTAEDIAAARKVIILANKIIGNGSPMAAPKGMKVIAPTVAKAASVATPFAMGSGGASRQKKAGSGSDLPLATTISCRALNLVGDETPACRSVYRDKKEVIVASKLIGNG